MKYMIASDIHGSSYYCQKLMDAYKYEKPDRLILLGDILYHGPRNDLPKEYAPKKVIEMLNSISDSILCVRRSNGIEFSMFSRLFCVGYKRAFYLLYTWTFRTC